MSTTDEVFTVEVDKDVYDVLKKHADAEGISVDEYASRRLVKYLTENKSNPK